ncbi:uncharacterized protein LOC113793879 [Dermatophagoides pteronyssinus]|uniref:uncharacterized protein LOC113793879 n=1 Tax=Dermatophagoides pteronyssinus TaxID=6956 RepID=UPI003F67BAB2
MNSNQKSISKHRTGGGGGQSQSNQRNDYQRSNQDRYQSHGMRSNNSNVSQACINAAAMNTAAAMQNSMGQPQLMRNYAPNQTQPALIGHQPTNIQMNHLNQQQQQQPTGGVGGPNVVSSQQAMSGMINAAAAAAAQQQRFPPYSVTTAQAQPQQQQRIQSNHPNSNRQSYNHPMRAGAGGSGGGANNTGAQSGGSHIPNHHHNNISYTTIPPSAAASIPGFTYAAAQNPTYYHPHHHPGSFHHQNQFSMATPVQQMQYGYPPMYYLHDYSRYPYIQSNLPQAVPVATSTDLSNQSTGGSYKPNDVQHHQQQQQQPGSAGQQQQQQQLQHQQQQLPMPIQPQPIKQQREKRPLEIYDEKGVKMDLVQLASEAKNKPAVTSQSNNNNNDTPNVVDNRSKSEKNVDNLKKTELNGPVKNENNDKSLNTTVVSSKNDDKTIGDDNNENKGHDNSLTSVVADSKPNEIQKQQQTTPTTPLSSSESSVAGDGHPNKSSCDMNNEPTISSTSTADSTSSSSSILSDSQNQSTINVVDEITEKVDKMVLNNNNDDDNSTTSTMDGDFVKVTGGDGDNVVDGTAVAAAAAAAVVIDGDNKESLEIDSTTSNDENNKSSKTVPVTTKDVVEELSSKIHQTTLNTTGDMESSFEIIDHINTTPSETSTPTNTSTISAAAAATVEMPMVNHDGNSNNNSRDGTPESLSSSSKSKSKPANIVGNKDAAAAAETAANNKSIVIDSRQYSRDALLQLRSNATELDLTNSNQENVRDIIRKPSQNIPDILFPMYAQQNRSMNDNTLQYRNKSMVQQSRRPSQPSRNYSDQKSRKIMSTSLHSDYPINSDEWRPGKIQSNDPAEIETGNLLKTVRSILNKLTPQNYHTLVTQFKALKIDSKDRLVRVIDLIFDKAVAEPAFIVQYAGFCSELIHIKVNEENDQNNKIEQVKFKNLLISKCQKTFFDDMYSNIKDLIEEVKTTEDPEKRKVLEEQLEDEKMHARKRSVGNIKFIAELFKINMLNASIMFSCFEYLLKHFIDHNHEEYIECLCALITNIGQNLTEQIRIKYPDHIPKFDKIFNQLEKIYNEELDAKVSPRIRFMILDLLDLRKNQWIPRRKTEGPKLIAQVHADMEMQQRLKNESANEMKKRQKQQQQQHQQHQYQNNAQNNDEWQQVNKRKSHHTNVPTKNLNFAVFRNFTSSSGTKNDQSNSSFSMFTSGSHGGSTSGTQSRSSSTNYENKNSGSSSNDKNQRTFHDSLNAKNYPQRGRDERKVSDVTNYNLDKHHRSDSQQSLKSSSSITANLSPTPRSDSMDNLRSTNVNVVPDLDPVQFQLKVDTTLKKYLDKQDYDDTYKEVQSFCSKTKCADFIAESILLAIDKTSQKCNPRERWGQFLGQFFCSSFCENTDIFESLKTVFAQYEDIKMDLPNFFQFVAEVIAYASLIIYEKGSTIGLKNDIMKAVEKAYNEISGSECALFRDHLLKLIEQKNKQCFSEMKPYFHSAQHAELDEYNKLDEIIDEYMVSDDLDQLKLKIKENFSKSENDEKFKCALYYKPLYACFKNHQNSVNDNATCKKLDKIKNLIKSFVNDKNDELLFLAKCETLFVDLNHPQKLLFEIFTYLHDNKLIQNESFLHWGESKKTSPIALMNVQRFMENLNKK